MTRGKGKKVSNTNSTIADHHQQSKRRPKNQSVHLTSIQPIQPSTIERIKKKQRQPPVYFDSHIHRSQLLLVYNEDNMIDITESGNKVHLDGLGMKYIELSDHPEWNIFGSSYITFYGAKDSGFQFKEKLATCLGQAYQSFNSRKLKTANMIHPVHGLNHHFDQVMIKRRGSLTEKPDRRSTFTRDIDQPKIEWMKFVQRFLVAMSMEDRQRCARTLVWNDELQKFDIESGLPSFMTFPTCQTSVNNLAAPMGVNVSNSDDDAESITATEVEDDLPPLESVMVKEEEQMDMSEISVNEFDRSSLPSESFESFVSLEKSSPEQPMVKVESELAVRVKIEPEVLHQLRLKLEEMINYPSTTVAATIPPVAPELTRSLSEEDDAGTVCEMDEEMESPNLSSPIMSLDELPPLESSFPQWADDEDYMSRQRSRPEYERM